MGDAQEQVVILPNVAPLDPVDTIYDSLANESLDDITTVLQATSVTSTLMFSMVMGMLFRNPIVESHRADFNNIICQKFEARKYVIAQLEARNVSTSVTFPDGIELNIKKELLLVSPAEGKCAGMKEATVRLDTCLRKVYENDPSWFPLASNTYVDPFCHASGHFLATKTYLEEHVNQAEFRTWAHSKWPGAEYPYDTRTVESGLIASVVLALTLFGTLIFYLAITMSRAREDETGKTLRRFSRIATPALLLLFLTLIIGLYFSIDFLLHIIELRVSSTIISHYIGRVYTISLSIGAALLSVWALAAWIYSFERACSPLRRRKKLKPSTSN